MRTRMCLSEQKTRLARIRATKSWGANAYLQYKRNGLLVNDEEEVTVETAGAILCHDGLMMVLVHAHLLTPDLSPLRHGARNAFIQRLSIMVSL